MKSHNQIKRRSEILVLCTLCVCVKWCILAKSHIDVVLMALFSKLVLVVIIQSQWSFYGHVQALDAHDYNIEIGCTLTRLSLSLSLSFSLEWCILAKSYVDVLPMALLSKLVLVIIESHRWSFYAHVQALDGSLFVEAHLWW